MAIMYKYTMGELPDENNMGYGNTKKKQGDKTKENFFVDITYGF